MEFVGIPQTLTLFSSDIHHCCPVNFEMTYYAEAKTDIYSPKCLFIRTVINNVQFIKLDILDLPFDVPTSCVFLKALLLNAFKLNLFQLTGQQ